AATGSLGFVAGLILITALFIFIFLTYKYRKDSTDVDHEEEESEREESIRTPMWKCIILVLAGILLLYFGARAFIAGAVELAGLFGVSELMIGLIVVALGVSLPEVCITVIAAYHKENELVVSNIVGSVVFNCFFALGFGVLFTTVPVTHYTMIFHLPIMVIMVLLLVAMVKTGGRITRWEGVGLVGVYVGYIALMALFPELTQGIV
ncbi:MAG: hypothetical protein LBR42_00690, partial [Candidatus Methanoplasma sp.]|nr:hypothetical protein [Candidatus Methanoplasma sp.]